MDLFDLFALYHKQGEYMKYNDFQKIGWTEKDYIYYIRSCEQIRSALISIHTMQEKLRVPQELRNVIGRNSFSYDELYEAIVQVPVNALIDWLRNFTEREIPSPNSNVLLYRVQITYGSRPQNQLLKKEDECDPYFVYISLFDLMPLIEEFIYMTLFSITPKIKIEPEVTDLSTESIKKQIRIIKLRAEYNPEPDLPTDIDNYNQIIIWASKYANYQDAQEKKDYYLEDLEEELRKRGIENTVNIHPVPIEVPTFDQEKTTLFVYGGGTIICKRDNHEIVDVNCDIETLDGRASINAQYCSTCKRFTISESSYYSYLKEYRLIPIKLKYIDEDGNVISEGTLQNKSPLMLAGYSVNKKSGLSEETRHRLLTYLIDNKIFSKYEIIDYLEFFIRLNKNNESKEDAIQKWENDRDFVQRYNCENQRTFFIDKLKQY